MTAPIETIGGIDVTAPIWRGVKPDDLRDLAGLLEHASFHFADDSGAEWVAARECLRRFGRYVNAARLDYAAICALHRDKPQLVTLADVMDAVLKDARK